MEYSAKYAEGYRQAFDDISEFLYNVQGFDGPHSSLGMEAEAGVRCAAYFLKYRHVGDVSLPSYYDDEEPETIEKYLKLELLGVEDSG